MLFRRSKTLVGSLVSGALVLAYVGWKVFRLTSQFEGDDWGKTQQLWSSDSMASIIVPGNWKIVSEGSDTKVAQPKNTDERVIGITHMKDSYEGLTEQDMHAAMKSKYPAGRVTLSKLPNNDAVISWVNDEVESGNNFEVHGFVVVHKTKANKTDLIYLTAVALKSHVNKPEVRAVFDHTEQAARQVNFIN